MTHKATEKARGNFSVSTVLNNITSPSPVILSDKKGLFSTFIRILLCLYKIGGRGADIFMIMIMDQMLVCPQNSG
jgi:hypothetical protein